MCVFFHVEVTTRRIQEKPGVRQKVIYIYIYIYICVCVYTKKKHPIKTYVALCWGMAAAMVVGPLLLLVLLLCCCCCFNAVEENPRKGKLRVGTGTCVVLVVAVVLAAVVSVLLLLLLLLLLAVVFILVVESSVVLRDRLLPVMAFVGDTSLLL